MTKEERFARLTGDSNAERGPRPERTARPLRSNERPLRGSGDRPAPRANERPLRANERPLRGAGPREGGGPQRFNRSGRKPGGHTDAPKRDFAGFGRGPKREGEGAGSDQPPRRRAFSAPWEKRR